MAVSVMYRSTAWIRPTDGPIWKSTVPPSRAGCTPVPAWLRRRKVWRFPTAWVLNTHSAWAQGQTRWIDVPAALPARRSFPLPFRQRPVPAAGPGPKSSKMKRFSISYDPRRRSPNFYLTTVQPGLPNLPNFLINTSANLCWLKLGMDDFQRGLSP